MPTPQRDHRRTSPEVPGRPSRVTLLGLLLLSTLLVPTPQLSAAEPAPVIKPSLRVVAPDQKVQFDIIHKGSNPISLAGCNPYLLERFVDDQYVPVTPKRCEWEKDAVHLPAGTHPFEFEPPRAERAIVRVILTYGTGCRTGVPLSVAQCQEVHTVRSSPMIILPVEMP